MANRGTPGTSTDWPQSLSGYDLPFDPEPDQRLTCPVCLAVLRNPIQTKCGHRFCKSCFKSSAVGNRPLRCPVDKTLIVWTNPRDLFVDVATEREVLSLIMKCSNHTIGCTWRGELRYLDDHLLQCSEDIINCERSCNMKFRRSHAEEHRLECPKREQSCLHCDQVMMALDMPKHLLLSCPKLPVGCVMCGNTALLREEISKHIDTVSGNCPMVRVVCEFASVGCNYQDQRGNMAVHYQTASGHHTSLMKDIVNKQGRSIVVMDNLVRNSHSRNCELFKLQNSLKQTVQLQNFELQKKEARIRELEETSYDGRYLWKIVLHRNYFHTIVSPTFYSGCPGYKVKLSFVAKNSQGADSHASVTLMLQAGKYDDRVRFPLDGNLRVTVINQSDHPGERADHRSKIEFRDLKVDRRNAESENARVTLLLMKTDELLNGSFVKDGVVFIHAKVNHVH